MVAQKKKKKKITNMAVTIIDKEAQKFDSRYPTPERKSKFRVVEHLIYELIFFRWQRRWLFGWLARRNDCSATEWSDKKKNQLHETNRKKLIWHSSPCGYRTYIFPPLGYHDHLNRIVLIFDVYSISLRIAYSTITTFSVIKKRNWVWF